MKRYIKASNAVQYSGADLNIGDRINITKLNGETTDIVGEITAIDGDVISVRDLYPIEGEDEICLVDLSSPGLVFEVYMTAEEYKTLNSNPTSVLHKIVETSKWWDPEGLDIPEDAGRVCMQGTMSQCAKWLADKCNEAKQDDFISVREYTPGKTLQLYYFNSQSKVNYVLV